MKRVKLFVSIVCTLMLANVAFAQTFGIGTSPQGSVNYRAGASIAKVLTEKAGFSIRVQPYSGSTAVVPLINSGELDFVLVNILEANAAKDGKIIFEGHPNPNLRAVSVLFPLRVGFFVNQDSDMRSISDLRGHAIPTGYNSQRIIDVLIKGLLSAGGLGISDIKRVPVPNIVRGADDFATGKAEAFFFAVGAGKVSQTAAKVGGVRLLTIDGNSSAQNRMQNFVKAAYFSPIKPAKPLVGVTEKTDVMTYDYLLLAGKHVSDDVIYKVTKTLNENKKALIASFGIFRGFKPDIMAKKMSLNYHQGAINFYKEKNAWPPKM